MLLFSFFVLVNFYFLIVCVYLVYDFHNKYNILVILTYLLPYTVSKLWLIIIQIFASDRGVPHFNALAGGDLPANLRINFTFPETRMTVIPDAKTARSYLHASGQNTGK